MFQRCCFGNKTENQHLYSCHFIKGFDSLFATDNKMVWCQRYEGVQVMKEAHFTLSTVVIYN